VIIEANSTSVEDFSSPELATSISLQSIAIKCTFTISAALLILYRGFPSITG
jgi:hypothetical protein